MLFHRERVHDFLFFSISLRVSYPYLPQFLSFRLSLLLYFSSLFFKNSFLTFQNFCLFFNHSTYTIYVIPFISKCILTFFSPFFMQIIFFSMLKQRDIRSLTSTLKHELLHALGFSSSLFAYFR